VHEEVLGVRQAQGLDEALNFDESKSRRASRRLPFIFFRKLIFSRILS
jgi:hypothetical protein